MITAVTWRGELDGEIVLTIVPEDGGDSENGDPTEVVCDRPGDLVVHMMAESFADEALLTVAAMYGYCLASRGIVEPVFVAQIVRKAGAFLRSARMESLPLYQLTERVSALVRDSDQRGLELRQAILEEAHRLRSAS